MMPWFAFGLRPAEAINVSGLGFFIALASCVSPVSRIPFHHKTYTVGLKIARFSRKLRPDQNRGPFGAGFDKTGTQGHENFEHPGVGRGRHRRRGGAAPPTPPPAQELEVAPCNARDPPPLPTRPPPTPQGGRRGPV